MMKVVGSTYLDTFLNSSEVLQMRGDESTAVHRLTEGVAWCLLQWAYFSCLNLHLRSHCEHSEMVHEMPIYVGPWAKFPSHRSFDVKFACVLSTTRTLLNRNRHPPHQGQERIARDSAQNGEGYSSHHCAQAY